MIYKKDVNSKMIFENNFLKMGLYEEKYNLIFLKKLKACIGLFILFYTFWEPIAL